MANRGRRCVRVSFLGTHRIAMNTPPSPVHAGASVTRSLFVRALHLNGLFCHLIVTVSVAISPVNGGL